MRSGSTNSFYGWQPGDPMPEEIAAACLEIRRGRDQREHYTRAGKRLPGSLTHLTDLHEGGWTAPMVRFTAATLKAGGLLSEASRRRIRPGSAAGP